VCRGVSDRLQAEGVLTASAFLQPDLADVRAGVEAGAATVVTPTFTALDVDVPVTVLRGAQTFPFLIASSDRLAEQVDGAELVIVPESVMHRPDPTATARVIAARV